MNKWAPPSARRLRHTWGLSCGPYVRLTQSGLTWTSSSNWSSVTIISVSQFSFMGCNLQTCYIDAEIGRLTGTSPPRLPPTSTMEKLPVRNQASRQIPLDKSTSRGGGVGGGHLASTSASMAPRADAPNWRSSAARSASTGAPIAGEAMLARPGAGRRSGTMTGVRCREPPEAQMAPWGRLQWLKCLGGQDDTRRQWVVRQFRSSSGRPQVGPTAAPESTAA